MADLPHPLGWPRALHPSRTPCRVDASLGARQHPCSGDHAELVESYRSWRDVEHERAEVEAIGYGTELEDYWKTHERPTFGRYLTMSRRRV